MPPKKPAKIPPNAFVINQQPINNDKNLFGASLETSDIPIGEIFNSAIVIKKYTIIRYKKGTAELS